MLAKEDATDEEKNLAKNELEQAVAALETAQNSLAAAQETVTAAEAAVEACKDDLNTAVLKKYDTVKDKVEDLEDQLKDAQDKITELEQIDITNYAVSFDKPYGEYVYTGSAIEPVVSVKGLEAEDFTAAFSNNVNAGTATVVITPASDKYKGSIEETFTILKKPSSLAVKAVNKTVKRKTVKKKKVTVSALSVTKATGKVTYKKTSGSSRLYVTSSGKIAVKKYTKKGTYKISVKVSDAGSSNIKGTSKTVTVKIRVK